MLPSSYLVLLNYQVKRIVSHCSPGGILTFQCMLLEVFLLFLFFFREEAILITMCQLESWAFQRYRLMLHTYVNVIERNKDRKIRSLFSTTTVLEQRELILVRVGGWGGRGVLRKKGNGLTKHFLVRSNNGHYVPESPLLLNVVRPLRKVMWVISRWRRKAETTSKGRLKLLTALLTLLYSFPLGNYSYGFSKKKTFEGRG